LPPPDTLFLADAAHFHGQQVNKSSLGKSLEVSHTTIQFYYDTTDLYMLRQLVLWSVILKAVGEIS
jgi:hypothetical protein